MINKEPLIIAETAFSHEGSIEYLKKMILELKNQENIAIKFQILIKKNDFLTPYNSIYNDIDKWILTRDQWSEVIDLAHANSVGVIIAALDEEAVQLASEKKDKVLALEIHPSCMPDNSFLIKAIEFCNMEKKALIIGISGFDMSEIDYLMDKFLVDFDKNYLTFMYGFQNYPTKLSAINLKKIRVYEKKYKVKIAYADHTEYNNEIKNHLISMAYGMGIDIFEIHYVLEYGKERIDYITAYDSERIVLLRDRIKSLYLANGEEVEDMNDSEKEYSIKFRKIPVYRDDFGVGHILKDSDIRYKRSTVASDYMLFEIETLVGKKLIREVKRDMPILKEELI